LQYGEDWKEGVTRDEGEGGGGTSGKIDIILEGNSFETSSRVCNFALVGGSMIGPVILLNKAFTNDVLSTLFVEMKQLTKITSYLD
jgi:hypothetical protein